MHDRDWIRTGARTLVMTAAAMLLLSAAAFAVGTPTLSAGCGSGATIVGSDSAGKVTLGTGTTTCVMTFSAAHTNAPACMGMNETNGGSHAVPAAVKTTTTQLTFDGAAPWSDDDTIAYICSTY